MFVFNPSPSPTPPNNLQHRTEINTRSRGGGCCLQGATTTPPSPPTLDRVSQSPGGTVPAPQSCLGGKPQRALPSSRDRGGPWGSRVEAELGGLQVVPGGGHSCPWSSWERSHSPPLGSGPAVCSSPRHSRLGNEGCVRGGTREDNGGPRRAHSSPSSLRLTLRGLARGRLGGAGGGPPSLSAWLEPRERRSWLCLRRKSTGAGQP